MTRRLFIGVLAGAIGYGQRRNRMFDNAEAYEQYMGRWSRLLAPRVVDFAAIPESGYVLDVGSGTGALTDAIVERRPRCRVLGIDPAKDYVAYASARNRLSRVRFEVGDAQQVASADGRFDSSVSLLVFNFIPDPRRALSELRRVTKRGGCIVAAVWDYGEGMQMLRVFWDAAVALDASAEKLDEKNMPLCRSGELARLWTEGGLEGVHELALEIAMRFESFRDYWEPFLLGQGPAGAYARRLDRDGLSLLREGVKRRLRIGSEAVPFSLNARAWAVRGVVPGRG